MELDRRGMGAADAVVRSLHAIDDVARSTSPHRRAARMSSAAFRRRWIVLRLIIVLAVLKLILGALGSLVAGPPAFGLPGGSPPAVAAAFSVVGLWLLLGARSDTRAAYLGGLFLTMAAAFAHAPLLHLRSLFNPQVGSFFAWRGVLPETLFPVFLWLFVREFPRVLHFSALEPGLIKGQALAVAVSSTAFAGNVVAALLRPDRPEEAAVFGWLARSHPSGAVWVLLFGAAMPALIVAWYRRREALPDERRRATLFIAGLLVGFAPLVIQVLLDALVPPVTRLFDDPAVLTATRWVVHGFLMAMPAVTAYAVRAQRVLEVSPAVGRVVRRLLVRSTLAVATVVPLSVLVAHLYVHRDSTLRQILSTPPTRILAVFSLLSAVLMAVRAPLGRRLDRFLFHHRPDLRAMLARITTRLHGSATAEAIAERLDEDLRETLQADVARLFVQDTGSAVYVPIRGKVRALPVDSAVAVVAAAAAEPLVVDPETPVTTFGLLPEADRHWVLDTGLGLILPLFDSAGRMRWMAGLGRSASGRPFTLEERQLLEAVAPAAALALENSVFRSGLGPGRSLDDTPAGQCTGCRRLDARQFGHCVCGGRLRVASLPIELNGKFRLIREAGRGGMGIVYQAKDLTLNRDVALKTLPRMAAQDSARLRAEARSMATVNHVHLALIFGAESWRGTPVLVMEYLPGGTLAARLAAGALPPAEALDLCSRITDALAAMHGRGLVHRDVKPSNIGFSAEGVPKLLDFGLAYLLDPQQDLSTRAVDVSSRSHHAEVRRVPGTALYLAPEVMAGAPSSPTQDLWSLALVLYECLIGSEPLRLAVQRSREAAAGDPFPGLEGLLPGHPLHARVVALLGDALSRDVRRRPPTAKAFREAVAAILAT